jgi:sporulation protein YlmC with PRC-barrel domain
LAERQTGSVLETRPRLKDTIELMRAHDIRDIQVRNPEGENLGDISDVAIDRNTGCIAYAVLSHGGILGFGEKHFAIPWEAVRTRPGERVAVVDADKRKLDSDPGFSRDRMPHEADWGLVRTPPPVRETVESSPPVAGREIPPARGTSTMGVAAGAAATGAAAATAARSTLREEEREVPPVRETGTTAARSTLQGEERDIPQPAVQTVAKGWGGEQRAHTPEERATPFPARTGESVVEEIPRERPTEMEARRPETVVEEIHEEVPETRRRAPSAARLSAADLQTYLKGIDYPVGRQDLVAHAQKNNAPESVITTLEGFSDRTYQSAADVSVEFGSETRGRHPARMEATSEEVRTEPARTAPSRGHLSAADLQTYLKGIDYPASKQDLITHARKNNAPEDAIMIFEQFGERNYRSATDVSAEFGRGGRVERQVETAAPSGRTGAVETQREPTASRRAAPSLKHLSAADLQTYLKGMDYPAGREDLVTHARKNDAPEGVIAALEQFSDRSYQSAADVSTEFGKIK